MSQAVCEGDKYTFSSPDGDITVYGKDMEEWDTTRQNMFTLGNVMLTSAMMNRTLEDEVVYLECVSKVNDPYVHKVFKAARAIALMLKNYQEY